MRFVNFGSLQALGLTLALVHPSAWDVASSHLRFVPDETFTQSRSCREEREQKRERDQRMEDVFDALGVRPGATIADVGAGQGFYTVRLAKAVGADGRVLAVDVSTSVVRDLRARVEREGLTNVEVIEGSKDDPRLPKASLDAALIVNAYHEMTEHQSMLTGIHRALKPDGRLVILEPISESRRKVPRDSQTRQHEIAPDLVLQDARAAGFNVVHLEDPFSKRSGHGIEWLMVLSPSSTAEAAEPEAEHGHTETPDDLSSSDLRIDLNAFKALQASQRLVVLDVRDEAMFEQGHIPGARLAPMDALRGMVDELKQSGLPIVAYCSCPAEETSARAVLYLRKHGINNARALVGGYEGWKKDATRPSDPGVLNPVRS